MRIAEDIAKDGMTAKGSLVKYIPKFIAENKICKVLETGTYKGTGTTMSVIDGMLTHGLPYEFYSIEVNPQYFREASVNVPRLSGIHLVNGLSIPFEMVEHEIDYSLFPEDIIVDHKANREELYRQEIDHKVFDDVIGMLLRMDFTPELVILDSAGHIGFQEYKYVRELLHGKDYWMILDDTNHIKHHLSRKDLEESGCEIVWSTEDKFGSLCARIKG